MNSCLPSILVDLILFLCGTTSHDHLRIFVIEVEIFHVRTSIDAPTPEISPPMTWEGRKLPKFRRGKRRERREMTEVRRREIAIEAVRVERRVVKFCVWEAVVGRWEIIFRAMERISGPVKMSEDTRRAGKVLRRRKLVERPQRRVPVVAMRDIWGKRL